LNIGEYFVTRLLRYKMMSSLLILKLQTSWLLLITLKDVITPWNQEYTTVLLMQPEAEVLWSTMLAIWLYFLW